MSTDGDQLRKEIEALQASINAGNNKINELTRSQQTKQAEVDKLEAEYQEIQEAAVEVENYKKSIEQERVQQHTKLTAIIKSITDDVGRKQAEYESVLATKNELNKDIETLKSQGDCKSSVTGDTPGSPVNRIPQTEAPGLMCGFKLSLFG